MGRKEKYEITKSTVSIYEIHHLMEIIKIVNLPVKIINVASTLYYKYANLHGKVHSKDMIVLYTVCIGLSCKILETRYNYGFFYRQVKFYFDTYYPEYRSLTFVSDLNRKNSLHSPSNNDFERKPKRPYYGPKPLDSNNTSKKHADNTEQYDNKDNEAPEIVEEFDFLEAINNLEVQICIEFNFDIDQTDIYKILDHIRPETLSEHILQATHIFCRDSAYLPLGMYFSEKKIVKACLLLGTMLENRPCFQPDDDILFVANEILSIYKKIDSIVL
ncbi:hypothetical protein EDEG_03127 [Edhazardia aedis USNM 41457]|uniref:Cyclin N-terminal domain-containing protein n=1 Tax=Edhazardia aedis (strain USNM 41457) TaxID=1003232 RepID=J9D4H0_EDHAE|nr:hypothetical protein EDEG_03127 [Edhazardia aedis USNM 41457]|eukprot:EJW02454.1 hypothetical protein EDEG_03127 [Edhazardia aedis USNM 41457]